MLNVPASRRQQTSVEVIPFCSNEVLIRASHEFVCEDNRDWDECAMEMRLNPKGKGMTSGKSHRGTRILCKGSYWHDDPRGPYGRGPGSNSPGGPGNGAGAGGGITA